MRGLRLIVIVGLLFLSGEVFAQGPVEAWVRRYNGPGNGDDMPGVLSSFPSYSLAVDNSGNIYVTGQSWKGTSFDYATIKYAPNGDTLWLRRYNGPGNGEEITWALAVDSSGNVYVTGRSVGSGTGYDFATIKYAPLEPIYIKAFSPVDLIVTDPHGDSISVAFNTIPGATYTEANDSIYIPEALPGDYKIRVVKDLLDISGDTSYTIEARIDGTADLVIAQDQPVPDSGESQSYVFAVNYTELSCIAKPGDVNGTSPIALPDVIHLVNYVFDKGRPATGCLGSEFGNCWTPGPLCRGDVNGSGGNPNLQDVIYLVNYVFDKDRLATSCLGSSLGNCWTPVASESCCLPIQ